MNRFWIMGSISLAISMMGARSCHVEMTELLDDMVCVGEECEPCEAEKCDPDPTCTNLADMHFGACEKLMGWGVIDGLCEIISGCDSLGYTFFETQEACQSSCIDGCQTAADCKLEPIDCPDCDCRAMPVDEILVECAAPALCVDDPCQNLEVKCVAGVCTAFENDTHEELQTTSAMQSQSSSHNAV